jgi:hypothetical protein
MHYPLRKVLLCLAFLCFSSGSALAKQPYVKIAWDSNPEIRVASYNVYRSTQPGSGYVRVNQGGPVAETSYVDKAVVLDATYHYVVTAIDLQGLESKFSSELTVKVQNDFSASEPIFLPHSMPEDKSGFKNTFVGVGLLNLNESPDQLSMGGVDQSGRSTGFTLLSQLLPFGRAAYATDQLGDIGPPMAGLLAHVHHDVHGFFLTGTKDLKAYDGMTEAYVREKLLYFPIARQTGRDSTLLSLFNSEEKKSAELEITAITTDGRTVARKTLTLPPFGSIQATLADLFGNGFELEDGYLRATSDGRIQGYQLSARQEMSLAGLGGQLPARARRLVLPHFFIDDSGGDTQLRLLNVESSEANIEVKAWIEGVAEPLIRSARLQPQELTVLHLRQLLDREDVPGALAGHLEVSVTTRNGAEPVYARVVGAAVFTANQGRARTATPLRNRPTERWVFPAVLESPAAGYFTGLALFNPSSQQISVTVRAFDDLGNLTGERSLALQSGQKSVGRLNDHALLGPQFSQFGGYLEVVGSGPLTALALFGDVWVESLCHIGPVLE